MKKVTRREVLGTGAVALGALLLRPPRLRKRPARLGRGGRAQPVVTASPPWDLLAPLGPGSALGFGWRVHTLSAVVAGSATLTLRHASGGEERIRILRRGGAPIGVAQTGRLDLLLMNGARGATPTNERVARVIRALAETVARHERLVPTRRGLASLQAVPAHYC